MDELRAGLEGKLRMAFTRQLQTRMGRKPTREEVDARIADLPGGSLLPDDMARKLIEMYDRDGDGVLRQSEFAPADEIRDKLEKLVRAQQEEQRELRAAEKQRERDRQNAGRNSGGLGRAIAAAASRDASATTTDKVRIWPAIPPPMDGKLVMQRCRCCCTTCFV